MTSSAESQQTADSLSWDVQWLSLCLTGVYFCFLKAHFKGIFMRGLVKSFCGNPIEPLLLNGEVLSTTKRMYRRPFSWGYSITITLFQAADENAHDSWLLHKKSNWIGSLYAIKEECHHKSEGKKNFSETISFNKKLCWHK